MAGLNPDGGEHLPRSGDVRFEFGWSSTILKIYPEVMRFLALLLFSTGVTIALGVVTREAYSHSNLTASQVASTPYSASIRYFTNPAGNTVQEAVYIDDGGQFSLLRHVREDSAVFSLVTQLQLTSCAGGTMLHDGGWAWFATCPSGSGGELHFVEKDSLSLESSVQAVSFTNPSNPFNHFGVAALLDCGSTDCTLYTTSAYPVPSTTTMAVSGSILAGCGVNGQPYVINNAMGAEGHIYFIIDLDSNLSGYHVVKQVNALTETCTDISAILQLPKTSKTPVALANGNLLAFSGTVDEFIMYNPYFATKSTLTLTYSDVLAGDFFMSVGSGTDDLILQGAGHTILFDLTDHVYRFSEVFTTRSFNDMALVTVILSKNVDIAEIETMRLSVWVEAPVANRHTGVPLVYESETSTNRITFMVESFDGGTSLSSMDPATIFLYNTITMTHSGCLGQRVLLFGDSAASFESGSVNVLTSNLVSLTNRGIDNVLLQTDSPVESYGFGYRAQSEEYDFFFRMRADDDPTGDEFDILLYRPRGLHSGWKLLPTCASRSGCIAPTLGLFGSSFVAVDVSGDVKLLFHGGTPYDGSATDDGFSAFVYSLQTQRWTSHELSFSSVYATPIVNGTTVYLLFGSYADKVDFATPQLSDYSHSSSDVRTLTIAMTNNVIEGSIPTDCADATFCTNTVSHRHQKSCEAASDTSDFYVCSGGNSPVEIPPWESNTNSANWTGDIVGLHLVADVFIVTQLADMSGALNQYPHVRTVSAGSQYLLAFGHYFNGDSNFLDVFVVKFNSTEPSLPTVEIQSGLESTRMPATWPPVTESQSQFNTMRSMVSDTALRVTFPFDLSLVSGQFFGIVGGSGIEVELGTGDMASTNIAPIVGIESIICINRTDATYSFGASPIVRDDRTEFFFPDGISGEFTTLYFSTTQPGIHTAVVEGSEGIVRLLASSEASAALTIETVNPLQSLSPVSTAIRFLGGAEQPYFLGNGIQQDFGLGDGENQYLLTNITDEPGWAVFATPINVQYQSQFPPSAGAHPYAWNISSQQSIDLTLNYPPPEVTVQVKPSPAGGDMELLVENVVEGRDLLVLLDGTNLSCSYSLSDGSSFLTCLAPALDDEVKFSSIELEVSIDGISDGALVTNYRSPWPGYSPSVDAFEEYVYTLIWPGSSGSDVSFYFESADWSIVELFTDSYSISHISGYEYSIEVGLSPTLGILSGSDLFMKTLPSLSEYALNCSGGGQYSFILANITKIVPSAFYAKNDELTSLGTDDQGQAVVFYYDVGNANDIYPHILQLKYSNYTVSCTDDNSLKVIICPLEDVDMSDLIGTTVIPEITLDGTHFFTVPNYSMTFHELPSTCTPVQNPNLVLSDTSDLEFSIVCDGALPIYEPRGPTLSFLNQDVTSVTIPTRSSVYNSSSDQNIWLFTYKSSDIVISHLMNAEAVVEWGSTVSNSFDLVLYEPPAFSSYSPHSLSALGSSIQVDFSPIPDICYYLPSVPSTAQGRLIEEGDESNVIGPFNITVESERRVYFVVDSLSFSLPSATRFFLEVAWASDDQWYRYGDDNSLTDYQKLVIFEVPVFSDPVPTFCKRTIETSVRIPVTNVTLAMIKDAGDTPSIKFTGEAGRVGYSDVDAFGANNLVFTTPTWAVEESVSIQVALNGQDYLPTNASDGLEFNFIEDFPLTILYISPIVIQHPCSDSIDDDALNITIQLESDLPFVDTDDYSAHPVYLRLTPYVPLTGVDTPFTLEITSDMLMESLNKFTFSTTNSFLCSQLTHPDTTRSLRLSVVAPDCVYCSFPTRPLVLSAVEVEYTSLSVTESYRNGLEDTVYLFGTFPSQIADVEGQLTMISRESTPIQCESTTILFINTTTAQFNVDSCEAQGITDLYISFASSDSDSSVSTVGEAIDLQFTFLQCPAGEYSPNSQTECTPCPIGTYNSQLGATSCLSCPTNTYASTVGSVSCSDCTNNSVSNEGSTLSTDCLCEANFYGPPGGPCVSCPTGSTCGSNQRWPIPNAGYYSPEPIDDVAYVYECIFVSSACPGGRNSSSLSSACESGFDGVACSDCMDNYYLSGSSCLECPDTSFFMGTVSAIVSIGIAYALFKISSAAEDLLESAKSGLSTLKSIKSALGINLKPLAIGINSAQVLSLFSSFKLQWPDFMEDTFSFFSNFEFNFLQLGPIAGPDCYKKLSFYDYLELKLLLPLAFLLVLICVAFTAWGISQCRGKRSLKIVNVFDKICGSMVIMLVYSYSYLSSGVLAYFDCHQRSDGISVIRKDPSFLCYSDEYNSNLWLAILGIILYVVGIPALLLSAVVFAKRSTGGDSNPRFLAWFGTFVTPYKASFLYYECLIMLRKLSIVLSSVFFSTSEVEAAVFGVVCLLFFLLFHVYALPYRSDANRGEKLTVWEDEGRLANVMDFLSLLTNLVVLFSGIVFALDSDLISDNTRTLLSVIDISIIVFNFVFISIGVLFSIKDFCSNETEEEPKSVRLNPLVSDPHLEYHTPIVLAPVPFSIS